MSHIIHKHSEYLICLQDTPEEQPYYVLYTNGDILKAVYSMEGNEVPEIPGFTKAEVAKIKPKRK
jgi:hypothetical protein